MSIISKVDLFDLRTAKETEQLEWQMPFEVDAFMAQCYTSITTGVLVKVEIPGDLNLDFDVRAIKRDHDGHFSVIGFNSPGESGKLILVEITFPRGLETECARINLYYGDGDGLSVSRTMVEVLL
jgi:hypothetical protein